MFVSDEMTVIKETLSRGQLEAKGAKMARIRLGHSVC